MDCICYDRTGGAAGALTADYCVLSGYSPVLALSDAPNEYRAFRELQNLVKRGECDTVVLPDRASLGGDRYIRLENELFFERNGVRLLYVRSSKPEPMRAIVTAIKRMHSFVTDWDESYGASLPEGGRGERTGRMLPFGYRIEDGGVAADEKDARLVRMIFELYIDGMKLGEIAKLMGDAVSRRGMGFSNMTVKTVLKNPRYLGRISKKGVKLPPVIRYDTWLKAKERLEREYGAEKEPAPFVKNIFGDMELDFVRSAAGEFYGKGYPVDSDKLEERLSVVIRSIAAELEPEAVMAYADREKQRAEKTLPNAAAELNRVIAGYRNALDAILSGDFSDKTQVELERLTDLKNVFGMRMRRIRSEKELFSVTKDEVADFLERARRVDELSHEEQGLIANAFIRAVRIRNGITEALVFSPNEGRMRKIEIDGVFAG